LLTKVGLNRRFNGGVAMSFFVSFSTGLDNTLCLLLSN